MTRTSMKAIREMDEKELIGAIQEARGELLQLMILSAKGTLRKQSGKIRPLRRDIARMLTRKAETGKKRRAKG